jgi:tetratricopeptide (TPR) repeat protein
MANSVRLILPALVLALSVQALHGETTGRLSGTVTTSDGKPVAGAIVVVSRTDVAWKKELKTDAKGAYFQVGLEPKEFEIAVSAPGFSTQREKVKVPLGDVVIKNIVLLTAAEAAKTSTATAAPTAENASIQAENDATDSFNAGAGFYSNKDYATALAPSEKAYKGFKEALEKTSDEAVKLDLTDKFEKANRLLGMVYFNVGKKAEARPLLLKHLEKNPKDVVVINAMLKLAKEAKDKAEEAKYQGMIDVIAGPQPEIGYNEGVVALNAGNMKGAKEGALKSLKAKADYADAYYILGIAEFGLNNLKASKEALKKYMELAPNGSKAAEVKEMLRELR